jgi:CrcB protein
MSSLPVLLAVGGGGFVGAVARYLISGWLHRHQAGPIPWGTLAVNVLGCAAIGFLMELALVAEWFSPRMRQVVVVGFLGSLTTFSTFGYETVALVEKGAWKLGLLNVLLNITLGVLAVLMGRWIALRSF